MMSYTDEWSEAAGEWKKGSEDERLNEETQNSRQRVNWKQRSITPMEKDDRRGTGVLEHWLLRCRKRCIAQLHNQKVNNTTRILYS